MAKLWDLDSVDVDVDVDVDELCTLAARWQNIFTRETFGEFGKDLAL